MSESELRGLHLAELHELAAERGIPRYRMLRRDELVHELARSGGGDASPRQREPRRRRGRRGGAKERPQRERLEPEPAEDEKTEDVSGALELTPQGHGFLRLGGFGSSAGDVYISAAQIRRCELRPGDEVSGPARPPHRGERHRALVHVDQVNGGDPTAEGRSRFEELTPILPTRRVPLDADRGDVLARAVDLLTPLALGQRVLVRAATRSGRTTLLRSVARAVSSSDGATAIVLLIDERPEEATVWRDAMPEADLATAPADLAPRDQVAIARLALERSQRLAEGGADVVLIVDSLSRLAVAADEVALVKRLFGSGRELGEEGAGSLTVVATVVEDAEDDGEAERAVITTETSLITLDPGLARQSVFPALRPVECAISNEEQIRSPEELDAARRLRSLLADLDPAEAARVLRERIEATGSNEELLRSL